MVTWSVCPGSLIEDSFSSSVCYSYAVCHAQSVSNCGCVTDDGVCGLCDSPSLSQNLTVRELDSFVNACELCKTAEPIEVPFWMWTRIKKSKGSSYSITEHRVPES